MNLNDSNIIFSLHKYLSTKSSSVCNKSLFFKDTCYFEDFSSSLCQVFIYIFPGTFQARSGFGHFILLWWVLNFTKMGLDLPSDLRLTWWVPRISQGLSSTFRSLVINDTVFYAEVVSSVSGIPEILREFHLEYYPMWSRVCSRCLIFWFRLEILFSFNSSSRSNCFSISFLCAIRIMVKDCIVRGSFGSKFAMACSVCE